MTATPVLFIWATATPNGRRNLEHGLDTQTWGFKNDEPEYHENIEYIVIGYDHSAGSPRIASDLWQAGTASLILCQRTVPPYVGHALHSPDEHATNEVIYPYRFGLTLVGAISDVKLDDTGLLGPVGAEALRYAAIKQRGVRNTLNLTPLMDTMGLLDGDALWDRWWSGTPDLSQTAGTTSPNFPRALRGRRGAGRSNDPALGEAVDNHAVSLAAQHLSDHGWQVKMLGKPYTLDCIKPDGTPGHFHVKGTTGAGGNVSYSPNEVHHMRTCPYQAGLIVVRDINVDRTVTPYQANGGNLLELAQYQAPAADLQATGWTGRVAGW